jgi:AcrR family transcriptional regulator
MPRGDRSTATRETLLQSAARVFIRRGQYGATVREIAEEAGLTVPAVSYHFDGTEELFGTLVRDGRGRFRAMLTAAIDESVDAAARLCAVARVFVRFGREDTLRLRLLVANLFGPHDRERPDREALELQAWIEEQLSPLMADALGRLDGDMLADVRLFLALMNGILLEQARAPEATLLDDAIADRAVAVFLHGARSR